MFYMQIIEIKRLKSVGTVNIWDIFGSAQEKTTIVKRWVANEK